jgi:hypothetical protein
MLTDTDSLQRLRREVRWLKLYAFVSTVVFGVVLLTGAARPTRFQELDAERINIVGADGTTRLVIANAARFPPIQLGGKTGKRSINPAGMVFYDTRGSEVGGLAVTDLDPGRLLALAFDYSNFDAIGVLTRVSPDGKEATAGLVINSRAPADFSVSDAARAAVRRVAIENHNETAQVVLSDGQGQARLQLRVDPSGEPRLEMLDEQGKVTYRLGQGGAMPAGQGP